MIELLLQAADRAPTQTVSDSTRSVTYADLRRLANIFRRAVIKHTRCERVGIMLPSSVGFAGVYFGVHWAGRAAVPLNFLLQPAELAAVVQDSGVDLIFGIRHFAEQLDALPVRTLYLEDLPLKREMVLERIRFKPAAPARRDDELAILLYTSGTSGAPKGVCLSRGNLLSNARDCIGAARLESNHRFLGILPLFHSFGLTAMLHAPVAAAAAVHYLPKFSPASIVHAIRDQRSSVLMAVASMYTGMLRLKSAGPADFTSLVYPISGGEALPMPVFEQFKQRFGVEILQGYGMTETSPVVSLNVPWAHRVGSVGKPVPNLTVAAHDDDGRRLDAGGTGELWVQGPSVMQGYYHKPQETAAVLTADGWMKTGDMGHVDADGYIFITGRKKELIIVGGENVYPGEIESVLLEHPAVAEAAAIGKQDPGRGEVVVAFVSCKEGATATDLELREFCKDKLANYKVPRQVIIRNDLPHGATGKILKRKLNEYL